MTRSLVVTTDSIRKLAAELQAYEPCDLLAALQRRHIGFIVDEPEAHAELTRRGLMSDGRLTPLGWKVVAFVRREKMRR